MPSWHNPSKSLVYPRFNQTAIQLYLTKFINLSRLYPENVIFYIDRIMNESLYNLQGRCDDKQASWPGSNKPGQTKID